MNVSRGPFDPTNDELQAIADDIRIGSWARDLAHLVLREREATERVKVLADHNTGDWKAEVARLRRTIEELIDQQGTFGASLTDWAEQKARAERAEAERDQARAALARVEALRDGALKTAWACPCTGPYTHGRHDDGSPGEFCGSSAHDEAWRRFSDLRAAIARDESPDTNKERGGPLPWPTAPDA